MLENSTKLLQKCKDVFFTKFINSFYHKRSYELKKFGGAKMQNIIQKYNPQQEFAVEKVYQKLTQGIENLPAEEAVDGLLQGVNYLRQGINQVVERIFDGAEQKQNVVMKEKADQWTKSTEKVKEAINRASSTGDYGIVEKYLKEATKSTITAKESVSKMKYIKQRGQTEYNPAKELTAYIRELEDFAKKDYIKTKLLEGEILP